jgi:hypothetical protein
MKKVICIVFVLFLTAYKSIFCFSQDDLLGEYLGKTKEEILYIYNGLQYSEGKNKEAEYIIFSEPIEKIFLTYLFKDNYCFMIKFSFDKNDKIRIQGIKNRLNNKNLFKKLATINEWKQLKTNTVWQLFIFDQTVLINIVK